MWFFPHRVSYWDERTLFASLRWSLEIYRFYQQSRLMYHTLSLCIELWRTIVQKGPNKRTQFGLFGICLSFHFDQKKVQAKTLAVYYNVKHWISPWLFDKMKRQWKVFHGYCFSLPGRAPVSNALIHNCCLRARFYHVCMSRGQWVPKDRKVHYKARENQTKWHRTKTKPKSENVKRLVLELVFWDLFAPCCVFILIISLCVDLNAEAYDKFISSFNHKALYLSKDFENIFQVCFEMIVHLKQRHQKIWW